MSLRKAKVASLLQIIGSLMVWWIYWLNIVSDQMVQADIRVHRPKDEISTPYDAELARTGGQSVFGKILSRTRNDTQFL